MKRFWYAVATSFGSKATTAAVQLVALPIAIRALGTERFALYAMLAAASAWIRLVNIGTGPALVAKMAAAAAHGDREAEKRLFASAILPISAMSIPIGAILCAVVLVFPVADVFGPSYSGMAPTIRGGLLLLTSFFLLQGVLSVVESAQLGYQEQHFLNLRAIGSNFVCVGAIVAVAKLHPSVLGMIIAVYGPELLFRIGNASWFLARRSFLTPRLSYFNWPDFIVLISNGFLFWAVGGIGAFLCHQLPVVLVGRSLAPSSAATFAAAMNVLLIAFGFVSTFGVPLWPAISDSLASGNLAWARSAYRMALSLTIGYALLVGIALAAFGRQIFKIWFGPTIAPSPMLLLFLAAYFILLVWEYVHYTVLAGVDRIRLPSLLYLCRAGACTAAMSIIISTVGESGPFIILAVSAAIMTAAPFAMLTRQFFDEYAAAELEPALRGLPK